jgi:hypothetical protein
MLVVIAVPGQRWKHNVVLEYTANRILANPAIMLPVVALWKCPISILKLVLSSAIISLSVFVTLVNVRGTILGHPTQSLDQSDLYSKVTLEFSLCFVSLIFAAVLLSTTPNIVF